MDALMQVAMLTVAFLAGAGSTLAAVRLVWWSSPARRVMQPQIEAIEARSQARADEDRVGEIV